MQTRHCDQCENFTGGLEPKCKAGHRLRYYTPRTTMAALRGDFGYKRKCADYIPEVAGKPVGKREHITDSSCWCHPELNYKDPDNGAEVWVHKEPT